MNKILTLPVPTEKSDMMYVLATMSTMRHIKPTKEAPAKGELLAYYTDTRVFTGVSPTNLATLKDALKDEVEVVYFNAANKFMEAVAEAYFDYLDTFPEEKATQEKIRMIEASTAILGKLTGSKNGSIPLPSNCGEGTLRIKGTYPNGQKFVQDICVACAKEAIAGDPNRIAMFNDGKSIQGLLMAVMGEAALQRIS